MVVQLRPKSIVVDRGSRGFGLSLIYRGLDKYEEKDTGIFVARVVPGGKIRCSNSEIAKVNFLLSLAWLAFCSKFEITKKTFFRTSTAPRRARE